MVYLYKMKKYLLNLLRNLSPKLFLFLKFYILKSKKSDINEHLGVYQHMQVNVNLYLRQVLEVWYRLGHYYTV